jgi:hypothetical protein
MSELEKAAVIRVEIQFNFLDETAEQRVRRRVVGVEILGAVG